MSGMSILSTPRAHCTGSRAPPAYPRPSPASRSPTTQPGCRPSPARAPRAIASTDRPRGWDWSPAAVVADTRAAVARCGRRGSCARARRGAVASRCSLVVSGSVSTLTDHARRQRSGRRAWPASRWRAARRAEDRRARVSRQRRPSQPGECCDETSCRRPRCSAQRHTERTEQAKLMSIRSRHRTNRPAALHRSARIRRTAVVGS